MEFTPSTLGVLSHLSQHGFATGDELVQFYPSKSSMRTGIWKLSKQGIIEAFYLGEFLRFQERSAFFQDLYKRSRKLAFYRLNKIKFPSVASAEAESKHDLTVSLILKKVKEMFPGEDCIFEKRLKRTTVPRLLPDITVRGTDFTLAIEYERTPKNKARHIERFYEYEASIYSHVLYVCSTESILRSVFAHGKHFSFIALSTINDPLLVDSKLLGTINLNDFVKLKGLKT